MSAGWTDETTNLPDDIQDLYYTSLTNPIVIDSEKILIAKMWDPITFELELAMQSVSYDLNEFVFELQFIIYDTNTRQ